MKFSLLVVATSISLRHARAAPKEMVTASAEATANAAAETEKSAEENLGMVTEARGFGSQARVAARAAEDSLQDSKDTIAKAIKEAKKVAMEAAKETLQKVKRAAAEGKATTAKMKTKRETEAEEAAAEAALKAAEPYNQAMLRAQKLVVEYNTRAQELAAASNNLKQQGQQLAGNANHYQFMGHVVQAQQMMMQAHSLFNQGDTMGKEARRLYALAAEVNAGIPSYQLASHAAAASAAESANPPAFDDDLPLPY